MSEATRETKTISLKAGEFTRSSRTISDEGTYTEITHASLIDDSFQSSMVALKQTLLCQARQSNVYLIQFFFF